jgi:hypothetical protein
MVLGEYQLRLNGGFTYRQAGISGDAGAWSLCGCGCGRGGNFSHDRDRPCGGPASQRAGGCSTRWSGIGGRWPGIGTRRGFASNPGTESAQPRRRRGLPRRKCGSVRLRRNWPDCRDQDRLVAATAPSARVNPAARRSRTRGLGPADRGTSNVLPHCGAWLRFPGSDDAGLEGTASPDQACCCRAPDGQPTPLGRAGRLRYYSRLVCLFADIASAVARGKVSGFLAGGHRSEPPPARSAERGAERVGRDSGRSAGLTMGPGVRRSIGTFLRREIRRENDRRGARGIGGERSSKEGVRSCESSPST